MQVSVYFPLSTLACISLTKIKLIIYLVNKPNLCLDVKFTHNEMCKSSTHYYFDRRTHSCEPDSHQVINTCVTLGELSGDEEGAQDQLITPLCRELTDPSSHGHSALQLALMPRPRLRKEAPDCQTEVPLKPPNRRKGNE